MRLYAAHDGTEFVGVFRSRKEAERAPRAEGAAVAPFNAERFITEYAPGQWEDAKAFKPEPFVEVILFRTYEPQMTVKSQTGFYSYGVWDGAAWRDRLFACQGMNDVKYWHALPALPLGETDGSANPT